MPSQSDHTSLALLEQLVYIDLYLQPGFENETPSSLELDEQLSMDLAMFADDAFVFPDESKGSASHSGSNGQRVDDINGPQNRSPIVGSSMGTFPRYPDHRDSTAINNNDFESSSSNQNFSGGSNPTARSITGPGRGWESALDCKARQKNVAVSRPFGDHDRSNDTTFFANYEVSARPDTFLNPSTFQDSGSSSNSELPHNTEPTINRGRDKRSSFLRHASVSLTSENGSESINLPVPGSSHLTNLPRFPVPPGAELSLRSVGLLQSQIDLLSALIAQHQANTDNSTLASLRPVGQILQHTLAPSLSLRNGRQDEQRRAIPESSSFTPGESLALSMSPGRPSLTDLNTSASDSISTDTKTESDGHQDLTDLDKRRRNTAALARFRVKKKLKEKSMDSKLQTMEQTAREFEEKIQRLEMENKLLRTLIVERGSKKSDEELEDLRQRAAKR